VLKVSIPEKLCGTGSNANKDLLFMFHPRYKTKLNKNQNNADETSHRPTVIVNRSSLVFILGIDGYTIFR